MPVAKNNPTQEEFNAWLRTQGADVLNPTSQYEFARFRAHGTINIIYIKANGTFTTNEFGLECLAAYRRNQQIGMGFTGDRRGLSHRKSALMRRDGDACFFCGETITAETATIEHLVGKSKGGPDHDDNLVLAHEACNKGVGPAPLIKKIRIHVEMQLKKARIVTP